ncbi:caspase family protein [Thermodesulfovibrio sp. TK110]
MKPIKLIIILILLNALYSFASEPPAEPILRIETGMHTAGIGRISIDKDERFLVTGSLDKTIRIWELRTGRPLKVIRPPVDEGKEGKIYAVAISPDGRHIAAGGWTGYEWDKTCSIYIFDRETGGLIKTIKGLPEVIFHLSFSKDGKFLVAGLGLNNGIRIYSTDGYSLIKEDKAYGDSVYGFDFSSDGRLVVSSYDGYIRLYDRNFNLIKKEKAPGGKRPYHISFSPDGSKIAVGYEDTPNLDILSSDDLKPLYRADTSEFSDCDFSKVTWSYDGRFLYAGGRCAKLFDNKWKFIIRRWDRAGKGSYIDIPVAEDTIMHILPLKDNGIAFASAEPSFGIVDASGRLAIFKGNEKADLRGQWEKFLLSYDGSIVRFGYDILGDSPAVFDAENRELKTGKPSLRLLPPIFEIEGIKITDWKNNFNPELNGKPIKLKQYEISRSLAISPDGKRFVLGTEWFLRCLDKKGDELWKVPAPDVVWAVNISGNGRVVVAGFGDGTIRWFRMEDGKELLTLFPHKDKKRWVLWTPKGYYDASPNAEDLIGWHINNGKDREADFFPVSRFRDRFYRPDIIAKLFTTYDEEKAIALANEESGRKRVETSIKDILPPVITILSPSDGSSISKNELTVRYSLRNPSGEPVTAIKLLIDGRPVSQKRGLLIKPKGEEAGELTVTVPERDFELSLIAENRYSASVPATIRLFWQGKKEEFIVKPKLYILAIGVSRYKDESLRLKFASKDAEDFIKTMKTQKGRLYEDVVVKLLTDEKATKDEILDGLDWLQKETTSKDIAMLFIAGHGINDSAGIYYFLPQNADIDKLKRTAVAFSDIKNTVSSIAGKVVMFVDTCHSGNVMGKRAVTDITGVINELTSAENGVVVFASSTGRQYSLEDPAWGNGAFTKAVVEGINGKADLFGKRKITINMLDAFIAERVKELTKGKQTPVTTKPVTVPDFPVAVR